MAFIVYALGTPRWESEDLDLDHTVSYLEDKTQDLCNNLGSMIMQAEDLLLDIVSINSKESEPGLTQR